MKDDICILENGVCYLLDNVAHTASVVASSNGKYKGNVVIALEVCYNGKYFPVTNIESYAFSDYQELLSVFIPNSIQTIGFQAFYNCSELTAIAIPDSVTWIGECIFDYCESLRTIYVPKGMASIFCERGLEPWRDKIVEIQ